MIQIVLGHELKKPNDLTAPTAAAIATAPQVATETAALILTLLDTAALIMLRPASASFLLNKPKNCRMKQR
jgi:hypothetical protein